MAFGRGEGQLVDDAVERILVAYRVHHDGAPRGGVIDLRDLLDPAPEDAVQDLFLNVIIEELVDHGSAGTEIQLPLGILVQTILNPSPGTALKDDATRHLGGQPVLMRVLLDELINHGVGGGRERTVALVGLVIDAFERHGVAVTLTVP